VQTDGKIIVGGTFSTVGTTPLPNIVRFTRGGAIDSTFNVGTGPNGSVSCVAVQSDRQILIGGSFASVNGNPAARLARLNPDGSLEASATFDIGTGIVGNVRCVLVQPDGKILIGGTFTSVNGTACGSIARLFPNGSLESTATFNPGTGTTTTISAMALQPDGKILIGGTFTTFNGVSRVRVARLNANGSLDTTFNVTGTSDEVLCLTVQPDSKIVMGGRFTSVMTQGRNHVARFTPTGALEPFNPASITLGNVHSLAQQVDGKLIITATTSTFPGSQRGVIRLLPSGDPDSTFDVGFGPDDTTTGVALQNDGQALIFGTFDNVGSSFRKQIARLLNDEAVQSLRASPGQVRWLRSGAAPELARVDFEVSSDGGGTWTPLGPGQRISGGWERSGVNLPGTGLLRARGPGLGEYPAIVEQAEAYTVDVATDPATLAAPAAGIIASRALAVSYVLPEPALPSSVKLIFNDGVNARELTLAAAGETSGAHALTFNPASPLESNAIIAGTALLSGTYSLSLSYRDAFGNPAAASAAVTPVMIDLTGPAITVPAPYTVEAEGAAGAAVLFTVSVSDNFDPAPFIQISPAPGSVFPLGTTRVEVTARDASGNLTTAGFDVTVQDRVGPRVAGEFAPLVLATDATGTAALPDYLPQAITLDELGVTEVRQHPLPGTRQTVGDLIVTVTARDAAGNEGTLQIPIVIKDGTPPALMPPAGGYSPLRLVANANGTAVLPDYASQTTLNDNIAATLVQVPAPATVLTPGVWAVTLTASDAAGNVSTTAVQTTVVDETVPLISAPAGGFSPLVLQTGPSGFAEVPDYTAQAASSDNVGVAAVTQTPLPGAFLPAGEASITLTAGDAAGNLASTSIDITILDATAPRIEEPEGGFISLLLSAGAIGSAEIPDYLGQASISDNVGVITATQDPPAGTFLPFGNTTVLLRAADAAGNLQEVRLNVLIALPAPFTRSLVGTGENVFGAGTDSRIPAGAKFKALGLPSVDDRGRVAFLAIWKAQTGTGSGIFQGNPPQLLVAAGEPAPGIEGAAFKRLGDPILAAEGALAFLGEVQGNGIKAADDRALWMATSGGLALVLREGAQVPGLPPGQVLKSITAVDFHGGDLVVKALLALAPNVASATSDSILLRITDSGVALVLREGDLVQRGGVQSFDRLAGFETLFPAAGAAGQCRWNAGLRTGVRLSFSDKGSALADVGEDGSIRLHALRGDIVPEISPTTYWAGFGLPAFSSAGDAMVVKGTLKSSSPRADALHKANDEALGFRAADDVLSILAREGDDAPGGGSYRSFGDPIINDQHEIAFLAKVTGAGVSPKTGAALFSGIANSVKMVARQGSPVTDPNGVDTPARWSRFLSFALPDGTASGPIFVAVVNGKNVSAKNSLGMWAVDSTGTLRQLVRTGDSIGGRSVVRINALTGNPGSVGAPRPFNSRGAVVTRVDFAGGGSGILHIEIPLGGSNLDGASVP
jgi:uncharacterized delta-60 repeat protein